MNEASMFMTGLRAELDTQLLLWQNFQKLSQVSGQFADLTQRLTDMQIR
jgi:hypothetical protein